MSYDLDFVASRAPSQEEFAEHFEGRAHYEPTDREMGYFNMHTGVYFTFERLSPEDKLELSAPDVWATFNLNFFRPSFFADEAVVELEAFVSRFGARVRDGGGDGEYVFSADGFLQSWGAGNEFAYRAILAEHDEDWVTRPAAELKRVWRWNLGLDRRWNELGTDKYMSTITFGRAGGRVVSRSVWPAGSDAFLPRTELVLVSRNDIVPAGRELTVEYASISWDELCRRTSVQRHGDDPLPHYFVDYPDGSDEAAAWLRSLPAVDEIKGIRMDEVLDAELIAAAR